MELLLPGCGRVRQISPPLRLLPILPPAGSDWDALPDELVARVLVLLPFSFLPVARCVCTKWRAVLRSPLFVKLFKACLQERGGGGTWLIEFHQHMLNQAWAYDLLGPTPRWFHLSFSFLPAYVSIRASSGGLICLSSSKPDGGGRYAFFVCNPMTEEWKELPPIPAEPSIVAIEVDRKLGSYRVATVLPSMGVVLTYDSSPDGDGGARRSWVAKQSRPPPVLEDTVLCNSILYCLVSSFRRHAKALFLCDLRPDDWNNPPVPTLLAVPNNAGCSSYLLACEEEEVEEGGGRGQRLLLVSELKEPPRLSFRELHVPSMEWRHPARLPKDASFCLSHSSSLCFPNPRERNAVTAAAYVAKSGKNHALVGTESLLLLPKSPLLRSKINHRDIMLTSLWFQPRPEAAV